jgi:hypothetical protein
MLWEISPTVEDNCVMCPPNLPNLREGSVAHRQPQQASLVTRQQFLIHSLAHPLFCNAASIIEHNSSSEHGFGTK